MSTLSDSAQSERRGLRHEGVKLGHVGEPRKQEIQIRSSPIYRSTWGKRQRNVMFSNGKVHLLTRLKRKVKVKKKSQQEVMAAAVEAWECHHPPRDNTQYLSKVCTVGGSKTPGLKVGKQTLTSDKNHFICCCWTINRRAGSERSEATKITRWLTGVDTTAHRCLRGWGVTCRERILHPWGCDNHQGLPL